MLAELSCRHLKGRHRSSEAARRGSGRALRTAPLDYDPGAPSWRVNKDFGVNQGDLNWIANYIWGIATYVWLLTNRKPEHQRGKIQLIDATGWYKSLRPLDETGADILT